MAKGMIDKLTRDLVRLLGEQVELHGQLAERMNQKLEAIRKADSDAIQNLNAKEAALIHRSANQDGLGKQLIAKLARELDIEQEFKATPSIKTLAQRIDEPQASQLLVTAAKLKSKLNEVNQLRVTNELISREMLKHLGEVVKVMKSSGPSADIYSRKGKRQESGSASVFEAVG